MHQSRLGFLATSVGSGNNTEQTGSDLKSPDARSDQFVAVTGPETEQVNASMMVVVAYGLFWVLAFGFVYMTYRSQLRLAAKVAEIEKKLPKDPEVS